MLAVESFAKRLGSVAGATRRNGRARTALARTVRVLPSVHIGFLPALQCPRMVEERRFRSDPGNPWRNSKDSATTKNVWERRPFVKDANLSMLLYGFLNFYAQVFPQQTVDAAKNILSSIFEA